MAASNETMLRKPHVGKKRKPPTRYWEGTEKDGKNDGKKQKEGDNNEQTPQQNKTRTKEGGKRGGAGGKRGGAGGKREKRAGGKRGGAGEKVISGKSDPFPGSALVPEEKLKKFKRGVKGELPPWPQYKLRDVVIRSEAASDLAQKQNARYDLMLPEDAGFLEGDKDEDTCTISQDDIADAVDITAGAKYFSLTLSQFGPYRLDYSKTGRHLLLGGRRGHVTCLDWQSKQLMCEMNVMETVNDVKWLHSEALFAVAQKKWLYIYDNKGIELHCIRKFNDVLRMQFLPYHFLLATASATGFLQYLDVSVGKEVVAICTKAGRLDVMAHNPHNGIIHLGHSNGTVTLWTPNQREPLVKMLCHQGGVRSVAVDKTGTYMVTSGMDKKLKVYDIRSYRPLQSYFLPAGASCLSLSQRGLLSAATGDIVQVYRDVWGTPVTKPYMAHRAKGSVWGVHFCPFEDVLGVGHGEGFTSMVVPGAGEPNFDGLDANPYRSAKQRQEWEVKALLEKIQPELIGLDPSQLSQVDHSTWEQRHEDRVQVLGFDPLAKEKFTPRLKTKGRSSSGKVEKRKKQVAHEDQRDVIRQTVEDRMKIDKERKEKEKKEAAAAGQKSALDRFRK
ncbi:WD repeat-containing protein 46 [Salvelinus fontinalis]|uniref:WD repeat-containing protein 46 n=1 Tax=Salvelinus fontinalis TaxID=8038 RepID=UPI002485B7E1|nr:WD repeat-containing protein 46 [Salvelinus fontinalis]